MDDGGKRRRPRHPPLERQLKSGDQVKKRSNKPSKGKKRLAERTEGPVRTVFPSPFWIQHLSRVREELRRLASEREDP